jgi:hypothetical protein
VTFPVMAILLAIMFRTAKQKVWIIKRERDSSYGKEHEEE